jgi:hypothetical protein
MPVNLTTVPSEFGLELKKNMTFRYEYEEPKFGNVGTYKVFGKTDDYAGEVLAGEFKSEYWMTVFLEACAVLRAKEDAET